MVRIRRRRIEFEPAMTWNIDFDPAVGVGLPDNVVSSDRIVFARQEPINDPSWYTDGTQQNCHRRSEVLTMSRLRIEKERGKRLWTRLPGEIEGVTIIFFQITLDECCLLDDGRSSLRDPFCE